MRCPHPFTQAQLRHASQLRTCRRRRLAAAAGRGVRRSLEVSPSPAAAPLSQRQSPYNVWDRLQARARLGSPPGQERTVHRGAHTAIRPLKTA